MSETRFEINANPSRYHCYYLLAAASLWWLPASFLLRPDILPWFTPLWLLVCGWLAYQSRSYTPQGEYNQGMLHLAGKSGRLSQRSKVAPGCLILMLDQQWLPAGWIFQDAVEDSVYRRLSQLILQAEAIAPEV